jgi:hypothetical protein
MNSNDQPTKSNEQIINIKFEINNDNEKIKIFNLNDDINKNNI